MLNPLAVGSSEIHPIVIAVMLLDNSTIPCGGSRGTTEDETEELTDDDADEDAEELAEDETDELGADEECEELVGRELLSN